MGKDIKNLVRNPDVELWREVMKMILLKKKAYYFRKPVDHVALNIPHYPTIVTQPMDLGTIESKLSRNAYTTQGEFASDVRLVFSNAMLFNKLETHQVHVAAKQLSEFFEARVKELDAGTFRPRSEVVGAKKANGQSAGTRSGTRSASKASEDDGKAPPEAAAAAKARAPARATRAGAAKKDPAVAGGSPRAGAKGGKPARAKAQPNPRAPPSTPRDGLVPVAEMVKMQQQLAKLQQEMAALTKSVQADQSREGGSSDESDADDDGGDGGDGGDDDDAAGDDAASEASPASSSGLETLETPPEAPANVVLAESPRPPKRQLAKLRFKVPKAPARPVGVSHSPSSDSLPTECVSLAGSSPNSPAPSGVFEPDVDPDASLDGIVEEISPEEASAYASAIVEMDGIDEDDELADITNRDKRPPPQAEGAAADATPRPAKKHRFTMSPADLSPVPPGVEVAKMFRGESDFGLSDSGLDVNLSTSPLWTFDENPPAPVVLEDGAE